MVRDDITNSKKNIEINKKLNKLKSFSQNNNNNNNNNKQPLSPPPPFFPPPPSNFFNDVDDDNYNYDDDHDESHFPYRPLTPETDSEIEKI